VLVRVLEGFAQAAEHAALLFGGAAGKEVVARAEYGAADGAWPGAVDWEMSGAAAGDHLHCLLVGSPLLPRSTSDRQSEVLPGGNGVATGR
jgi:hypothetical protein